jgi:hypothetical protein
MPATPEQWIEFLDCTCPGDIQNETFKRLVADLLAGIVGGSGIVVTTTLPTAATSNSGIVLVNNTATAVLGSNPARKGGWVKNISDVNIWVALGSTAAITDPTLLTPGSSIVFGVGGVVLFTGTVSAIHNDSGTKSLEVVEF